MKHILKCNYSFFEIIMQILSVSAFDKSNLGDLLTMLKSIKISKLQYYLFDNLFYILTHQK
jgi:hypothetical protein